MKHTKKRIARIMNEMMTYLFCMGATNIHMDVIEDKKLYKMKFVSNYIEDEEKIEKLIHHLHAPKQEGMEEYYWELAGECDVDTELTLVGMMIDEVSVNPSPDKIEITLYKYK